MSVMQPQRVRVVVVDDQQDVRDLLTLRLRRHGNFDVVAEGADGQEAIILCETHRPDIAIVDAAMPVMNGLEAVPQIVEGAPETAIVIYTAEAGLATRNEAERVGAHAVVGKLDPFERLVETIFRLRPDLAPSSEKPVDLGIDRMEKLLAQDAERSTTRSAASKSSDTMASKTGISRKFVLLAVLVLLPGLAFLVWFLAVFGGLIAR